MRVTIKTVVNKTEYTHELSLRLVNGYEPIAEYVHTNINSDSSKLSSKAKHDYSSSGTSNKLGYTTFYVEQLGNNDALEDRERLDSLSSLPEQRTENSESYKSFQRSISENGKTSSVYGLTIPESDTLHWYKTQLYSHMIIDCHAHDVLLCVKNHDKDVMFLGTDSTQCDRTTYFSLQSFSNASDQTFFRGLHNLIHESKQMKMTSQRPSKSRLFKARKGKKKKQDMIAENSEQYLGSELLRLIHCYILPELPVTSTQTDDLRDIITKQEECKKLADVNIYSLADEVLEEAQKLKAKRVNIMKNILQDPKSELGLYALPLLQTLLEDVCEDYEEVCRHLLAHNYERSVLQEKVAQLPCQKVEGTDFVVKRNPSSQTVLNDLAVYKPTETSWQSERSIEEEKISRRISVFDHLDLSSRHVRFSQWYHNPCNSHECPCVLLFKNLKALSTSIREEIQQSIFLVHVREVIDDHIKKVSILRKRKKSKKSNSDSDEDTSSKFSSNPAGFEYIKGHACISRLEQSIKNAVKNRYKLEMTLHAMKLQLLLLEGQRMLAVPILKIDIVGCGETVAWQPLDEQVNDLLMRSSALQILMNDCIELLQAQCQLIVSVSRVMLAKQPPPKVCNQMTSKPSIKWSTPQRQLNGMTTLSRAVQKGLNLTADHPIKSHTKGSPLSSTSSVRYSPAISCTGSSSTRSSTASSGSMRFVQVQVSEETGVVVCDVFEPYADIARAKIKSCLLEHFQDVIAELQELLPDKIISDARLWTSFEKCVTGKVLTDMKLAYRAVLSSHIQAIYSAFDSLSMKDLNLDLRLLKTLLTHSPAIMRQKSKHSDGKRRCGTLISIDDLEQITSSNSSEDSEKGRKTENRDSSFPDVFIQDKEKAGPFNRQSLLHTMWSSDVRLQSTDVSEDSSSESDESTENGQAETQDALPQCSQDPTSKTISNTTETSVKLSKFGREKLQGVLSALDLLREKRSLTEISRGFIHCMEALNESIKSMGSSSYGNSIAFSTDDLMNYLCLTLCNCPMDIFIDLFILLEILLDCSEGYINETGFDCFVIITFKSAFTYIIDSCHKCDHTFA